LTQIAEFHLTALEPGSLPRNCCCNHL